jgi:hypothetical protein
MKAMESITVYPKNAKQKSMLKSLLEEMKIQFDIAPSNEEALFNEEAYFAKIDRSVAQIESGKTKRLSKENQKEFLGL